MNITLSQSRLKRYLKKMHNLDLTEVLQDVGIPDYLTTSITPEELYEIYKEEN